MIDCHGDTVSFRPDVVNNSTAIACVEIIPAFLHQKQTNRQTDRQRLLLSVVWINNDCLVLDRLLKNKSEFLSIKLYKIHDKCMSICTYIYYVVLFSLVYYKQIAFSFDFMHAWGKRHLIFLWCYVVFEECMSLNRIVRNHSMYLIYSSILNFTYCSFNFKRQKLKGHWYSLLKNEMKSN